MWLLVGEPKLNIWLCLCGACCLCGVCVMCGVPWIDAMLWSVIETTVQSQSVCTVHYMHTYNCWHNTVMNIGMSIDIAWFPDYGHILASIFWGVLDWMRLARGCIGLHWWGGGELLVCWSITCKQTLNM